MRSPHDPELAREARPRSARSTSSPRTSTARYEIVEENLDECVLCELCLNAAPAGTVQGDQALRRRRRARRLRRLWARTGPSAVPASAIRPPRVGANVTARRVTDSGFVDPAPASSCTV